MVPFDAKLQLLKEHVLPLEPEAAWQARIPTKSRFVLLGCSTHGSSEFYDRRCKLAQWLIEERGFNAVVVEGDFPDAFRANMFVRGLSDDPTPAAALADFKRFPTWMWRNREMASFLQWLKDYNAQRAREAHGVAASSGGASSSTVSGEAAKISKESGKVQAGLYGMDIYSLCSSMSEVISYMEKVDPVEAARMKEAYACFYTGSTHAFEYAKTLAEGNKDCREEAVALLKDIQAKALQMKEANEPNDLAACEHSAAAQLNALAVRDAEEFYRSLLSPDEVSWSLRDRHMFTTVKEIVRHLQGYGIREPKVAICAHVFHLGSLGAKLTGPPSLQENLGYLLRQEWGSDVVYDIGFMTNHGTVAAATRWGDRVRKLPLKPCVEGSYEDLLHSVGLKEFCLPLMDAAQELREALSEPQLERLIGVIYSSDLEMASHYLQAVLPQQADMVIHIDETKATQPLDETDDWNEQGRQDLPDMYPSGY